MLLGQAQYLLCSLRYLAVLLLVVREFGVRILLQNVVEVAVELERDKIPNEVVFVVVRLAADRHHVMVEPHDYAIALLLLFDGCGTVS